MTKEGMMVLNIVPAQDYKESEAYATDIFNAIDGTEKRFKKTNTPKRTVAYTLYTRERLEMQSIEGLLTYGQKYNCLQPLWFSASTVLNAGTSATVTCDTTKSDFKIGNYALVRKDFEEFYCEKITAIKANSINLEKEIELKIGMQIIPMLKCMPTASSYSFQGSDYSEWKLEFRELL
jgi:hypothetical protein